MSMTVRTCICGAALAFASITAPHAQITETMTFKTTFPFTIGNTTYPAGSYSVKRADENDGAVLELSSGTTTTLFAIEPESLAPAQTVKDEVTFKKYGEHYVLSDIWSAADGSGARVEVSWAEQRHAKKHGKPSRTSVAASRASAAKR